MSKAKRTLPDPEICRTKTMESDYMMECLVERPVTCADVIRFGGGYFCRHPDRKKFEKPTDRSV
jgi:hypothetical protein